MTPKDRFRLAVGGTDLEYPSVSIFGCGVLILDRGGS